jgi:replicative DNA helicase
MATLFDTTDIERSLLKLFISSKSLARREFHRVEQDWFTSPERQVIFEMAKEYFERSKTLLTRKIFSYELDKDRTETDRSYYVAEWNMIVNTEVSESSEALIDLMRDAFHGRQSMGICEEVMQSLERGDVVKAVATLKSKSIEIDSAIGDRPVVSLADYERRKQHLLDRMSNPDKYKGMHTDFNTFDRHTGGLFPAEFTLIAAVTGVGKSTLMKMIEFNLVRQGYNCLHITNEESQEQVETKFDSLISEVEYLSFKRAGLTDARFGFSELKKWEESLHPMVEGKCGVIYIKEIPQWANAQDVERVFVELQQKGVRIDVVFVDYMDMMMPVQRSWSEYDEQGKVAADLKGLAVTLHVPLISATQAATIVEEKQNKGSHFGKLDVYGSKRKIHHSNTFMGIMRREKNEANGHEGDWESDVFWDIEVKKNRDGPPFVFPVLQTVKTGRVVETTEALAKARGHEIERKAKKKKAEEKKEEAEKIESPPENRRLPHDEKIKSILREPSPPKKIRKAKRSLKERDKVFKRHARKKEDATGAEETSQET